MQSEWKRRLESRFNEFHSDVQYINSSPHLKLKFWLRLGVCDSACCRNVEFCFLTKMFQLASIGTYSIRTDTPYLATEERKLWAVSLGKNIKVSKPPF